MLKGETTELGKVEVSTLSLEKVGQVEDAIDSLENLVRSALGGELYFLENTLQLPAFPVVEKLEWIQCTSEACQKWRIVPTELLQANPPSADGTWHCFGGCNAALTPDEAAGQTV